MNDDLISRRAEIAFLQSIPYIKEHPNMGELMKEWIEQIPNDLISRQAAIKAIHDEREWLDANIQSAQHHYLMMNETAKILGIIENLPAVQSKQKTGQWLINSDGHYPYCSRCKREPRSRIMTKYCAECGAFMEA